MRTRDGLRIPEPQLQVVSEVPSDRRSWQDIIIVEVRRRSDVAKAAGRHDALVSFLVAHPDRCIDKVGDIDLTLKEGRCDIELADVKVDIAIAEINDEPSRVNIVRRELEVWAKFCNLITQRVAALEFKVQDF